MTRQPESRSAPPAQAPDNSRALEILQAMEIDWTGRVASGSTERTLDIYTEDAFFFGSTPHLHVGRENIRHYFDEVPEGYLRKADFFERQARFVAEGVILASSYVDFTVFYNGEIELQNYRITFCLVETDQGWKIAQHHASRILGGHGR
ncbi:SgcJ/EcaC family oxidoreductase [Actibacterium sp. D379-3]